MHVYVSVAVKSAATRNNYLASSTYCGPADAERALARIYIFLTGSSSTEPLFLPYPPEARLGESGHASDSQPL